MTIEFRTESVEINGKKYTVKELSGRQRKELPKLVEKNIDIESYCIKECVEEFKDSDIDTILDLPSSAYIKLAEAILKLSGLAEDSSNETKKNS